MEGVIWTAGLAFNPPPITPAVERDRQGRLRVDPHLRLIGHTDLFALGDLAAVGNPGVPAEAAPAATDPGAALPINAQVAFQQASCLASNLLRARRGEPLEAFHFQDLGEMLSLGRGDASLVAGGFTLAGPAAFQLRRLAYLARLPGRSHQLRVAAGWLADW